MRRGIFHKYLLGFTSFFLVPMVVLSICLQIIMYRNLSREILGYNENILERLGDDLVTMNGRLMEAGTRISFSGPVVSRSRDAQNQIQMVDMLREENAANPYITKAYILYENGDVMFFFPRAVCQGYSSGGPAEAAGGRKAAIPGKTV